MSSDVQDLVEKIKELENQLLAKDNELFGYQKTVSLVDT